MDDTRTTHPRAPFTPDNCEGYTAAEMATLNVEFLRRWNGWEVDDAHLFVYANGEDMSEEEAIHYFQDEVSRR